MNEKVEELKRIINQFGSVVVALSGGVDSSLLAKVCFDELGSKALAVTIVSPMIPKWDLTDANALTAQIGMNHMLIRDDKIGDEVRVNPANRCYHCKKTEFGEIIKIARERGFTVVVDGSNADDKNDYRPGAKAMEELQVVSPLKMAGFTKKEIRQLSKKLGLRTWDKPAYACLASRIPYGEEITLQKLTRIENAEEYLHTLGYEGVRVRSHGDIARIEIIPSDREQFCKAENMDAVSKKMKEFGFLFVCLELEGYKMGNLNRALGE